MSGNVRNLSGLAKNSPANDISVMIAAVRHVLAGLARTGGPTMLKKLFLALVAGSIALAASACNTVRGVGQDLESAANAVDDAT